MRSATVEEYNALDIRAITRAYQKNGNGGAVGSVWVRVDLMARYMQIDMQKVALDTTPCNYGGVRWWAVCPECGRRCAILYHASEWACRTCLALSYCSERSTRGWRLWFARAIHVIRQVDPTFSDESGKLALSPPFAVWPNRPKGMHASTYARLYAEFEHYDMAYKRELSRALAKYQFT